MYVDLRLRIMILLMKETNESLATFLCNIK